MANLFDQANERKKWDATIAQVGQMGYPQNPAQPPAFTSPQPRRPASFGDAAAATSNPGVTQLPPSATQGSAPGPSTLYMQDRADELRTQVGAGNYAQAAGTAARTAVQGLGMYGIELADKLATPAINAAASFGRGVMGAGSQAAPTTTPATTLASAVPGAPPQAAPTAPNPTDQRLAMGTQTAQPTAPALPTTSAPAPSAQPAGNEIAPGVYRNAPGQYSDNAQGMNMPAGFTGRPNQQNLAAAANLAAAQQPSSARGLAEAALSQPSGVQAPVVRNSTNDWAARNNLRNASVSASSITNNGGKFDRSGPGDSAAMAEYKAALATDQALQQAQPGADITAMRENAGIQREGMQQDGATARTGMQEQGASARDAGRTALARDEFGLRKEAAGFQNRAAQQQEQLRNVLIDPKATPEQRKQAQEYLQALAISGKEPSPQYKSHVMPAIRNADGSTTEGGVYQENTRTGEGRWVKPQGDGQAQQAMPKPASKAEFDALPKGARFTDPNGQVRIK